MNYLENIDLILKQEGFCLSGLDSSNDPIDIQYLINAFTAFKCGENQQRLVVQIARSRDFRFFNFLEHCIFSAANENIRFGTLKYLHYFKLEKNLLYIFETIDDLGLRQAYEPYFSVSVNMVGGECKAKFGGSVG